MSQQINLFQQVFRKEPKRFAASTLLFACAMVLVVIALIYGAGYWQTQRLRAELQQAQRQQVVLAERLEELSGKLGTRAKSAFLEKEIARLQALIAAKSRVKQILERGVFANTQGYSEYLLALARQHVAGVWLTSFAIAGAGERLTIKGRTTVPERVPQYMQKLAGEQTLSGIVFQIFRMARPQEDAKKTAAPFVEFLATTASSEEGGKL